MWNVTYKNDVKTKTKMINQKSAPLSKRNLKQATQLMKEVGLK